MEVVSWVVYGTLGVVASLFWYRRRTIPAAWLAATFVTLGLVVLQGAVIEPTDPALQPLRQFSPREIYTDVIVVVLLGFPYLLHRFSRSLRPRRARSARLADLGMVAIVASVIIAPGFPPPDQMTGAWGIYQLALIGWWAVLLGQVSWSLWRIGRGRPGVVRNRMRLMSVASGLMNLALLVTLGSDPEADSMTAVQILSQLLGWASAGAFLMAFEPPALLRRLWRGREEDALRRAETGLVVAQTPMVAAAAIVGAAASLVGGEAAIVRDRDGNVLATTEVKASHNGSQHSDGPPLVVGGDVATVEVQRTHLSPVFGEGESALLAQLCGHLELALTRIAAYQASERARIEAERANTELTQLVYGVSHDLRNPLVTVLGFLGLLRNDASGLSETQVIAVDRITASAHYMEALIDDLLQLSRVGRIDAEVKSVDVGLMATTLGGDLAQRFEGVSVAVDAPHAILINPVRAQQLLTNLMENAARHGTTRPLVISVRTDQVDDDMVSLTISDNGIGIPAEHHDRVFQIFQRLERFDAEAEGSGIGLTMSKRIAEDVGGSIAIVDNLNPDDPGTTFRILLPAAAPAPSIAAAGSSRSPQRA